MKNNFLPLIELISTFKNDKRIDSLKKVKGFTE